jgi:hypothetical protein
MFNQSGSFVSDLKLSIVLQPQHGWGQAVIVLTSPQPSALGA